MILLVVADQEYNKVGDIICKISKSGAAGDGKIFISTIDEVIRVRTEECGEVAL